MALQIFNLYRIKTKEMLQDTITYLVDKFKQSRKIFTVASPFGQILFVLENIVHFVLYYIEDSVTELNIKEATRDSSVYGIAEMAGYSPSRSVAASGQVSIIPKISPIDSWPSDLVIIPNYSKIRCLNNDRTFVMVFAQDELRVSLTDIKPIPVYIQQGIIETQIFTGKRNPFESVSVQYPKNYFIDNYTVNVYVNDVKWPVYRNLLHMPRNQHGCMIKTGSNSGFDIFFGTKQYGAYPNLGDEIKVEYLATDGYGGVIHSDNPEEIKFEFVDTGFSQFGDEIILNDVMDIKCVYVPDFGSNPESIALTRLMLTKADIGLVDIPSYELLLRRMQAFSVIRVYRDTSDPRMVNIFLVPDVKKLIQPNESYFTIPEERFILSNQKVNQLLQYIEKNGTKLIGSDNKIISPIISKYVLNVNIVAFDDIAPEIIKSDIITTISDYFLNISRRNRIPKSDLIKKVEEINGVDSVNITIISQKNEDSKILNPKNADIGIDAFNDIIIADNELPIIRGGWRDRTGNSYAKGIIDTGLGAINIVIRDITQRPKNYN